MQHIHSYPSIYAIGHKAIADIFSSPVLIEEKVDGSQFSFGRIDGELVCRSKGKDILLDAPEKMFGKAIEVVKSLPLHDGWIYRGEYLQKPKHNTLQYSRVPNNHIIIFDINTGLEEYMSFQSKLAEATRLGLEMVTPLFHGMVDNFEVFKQFLEKESALGGCLIEGVVVKNYSLFTQEKKVAMGKYVSEHFKETHAAEWKKSNPSQGDIEILLINEYRNSVRWQKAVQHLKERGELVGSPEDIGKLMREVPTDILKECEDEIKEKLFKHFWPKISRSVTRGLPEWYKDTLAKQAFETDTESMGLEVGSGQE